MLVRCHAGCDQRESSLRFARAACGRPKADAGRSPRRTRRRPSTAPDPDAVKRTEAALAIWQASQPAVGTPVETYLRSRGLHLPPPPALRFHAGLKHPSGGIWPAMVALVTRGVDSAPIAIHRTFLARDGGGKAPVDPAEDDARSMSRRRGAARRSLAMC